jgi:hypothetical protein
LQICSLQIDTNIDEPFSLLLDISPFYKIEAKSNDKPYVNGVFGTSFNLKLSQPQKILKISRNDLVKMKIFCIFENSIKGKVTKTTYQIKIDELNPFEFGQNFIIELRMQNSSIVAEIFQKATF